MGKKGSEHKGKKKLTTKELKAQNHAKLMANKSNTYENNVIQFKPKAEDGKKAA